MGAAFSLCWHLFGLGMFNLDYSRDRFAGGPDSPMTQQAKHNQIESNL
jgi:hypothetical protein